MQLVLLLGSEQECTKCHKESYADRHIEHAAMNRKIEVWTAGKNNVTLICYDRYIHNQHDFVDTINHFVKRVYHDFAKDLAAIIEEYEDETVKTMGKTSLCIFRKSCKETVS